MIDHRQPRHRRTDRVMAVLATVGLLIASLLGSTPAQAATSATYGDYSMMFTRSAGQYANGTSQWAWSPVSATESRISWGSSKAWPPAYNEQFVRSGDWVTLIGWFDNGTFYRMTTEQEWQAGPDCRTGRTALPAGGPQHYVRWALPAAAYCLFAAGTITEQSSGKVLHFQHQQLWTPPAADRISQWESWSDDRTGAMTLSLERTQWLGRGKGPAQRIEQTFPSAWSTTATATWKW
jgi:hypothetical protein